MPNKNIVYKSKGIYKFFSSHRQTWQEFYPSERWVFDRVAGPKQILGDVLDVGCACAGLGAALVNRFRLKSYTGVDINKDAVLWAVNNQRLPVSTKLIAGDILKQKLTNSYDTVVSLSCADWNIETKRIIDYCWKRVRFGGYLVISLRIAKEKGINNIKKSYQYIDFKGKDGDREIANYVVFNFKDTLKMFAKLRPAPSSIGSYGYWGRPSPTAVTLFERLVFAVFYIQKGECRAKRDGIKLELNLPADIFL